MKNDLSSIIESVSSYIENNPSEKFDFKPSVDKWSKKEILGHLTDSALYNLKRFLEIQFKPEPYLVSSYEQNELVIANHYQSQEIESILKLWVTLNQQIVWVISKLPEQMFSSTILLPDKKSSDLAFLIEDYIEHLNYHAKQIMN